MNKPKTVALLGAILAVAVVAGATVAVLAPMEAFATSSRHHSSNNQQNQQGAFNFNNQQSRSNFQCVGCNP
jgi:hypothetical protein